LSNICVQLKEAEKSTLFSAICPQISQVTNKYVLKTLISGATVYAYSALRACRGKLSEFKNRDPCFQIGADYLHGSFIFAPGSGSGSSNSN